jgi:hypothetical protein
MLFRRLDPQFLAEVEGRLVEALPSDRCVEVQLIPARPAPKALKHIPGEIHRKSLAGVRLGTMNRAWTAALRSRNRRGVESDKLQDLGHGNQRTNLSKIYPGHCAKQPIDNSLPRTPIKLAKTRSSRRNGGGQKTHHYSGGTRWRLF